MTDCGCGLISSKLSINDDDSLKVDKVSNDVLLTKNNEKLVNEDGLKVDKVSNDVLLTKQNGKLINDALMNVDKVSNDILLTKHNGTLNAKLGDNCIINDSDKINVESNGKYDTTDDTVGEPTDCTLDFSSGLLQIDQEMAIKYDKLNVLAHSPLNPASAFFHKLKNLSLSKHSIQIHVKSVNLHHIDEIFSWYFNKPLPNTSEMFPWLHGLHQHNFAQKQFFLHQQSLGSNNIFKPYTLSKPTNIRFLMCINLATDSHQDSNPNILHHPKPTFVSSNNLKNTVKINEILQKVDVSKLEVRNIIADMIDDLYNIDNDQITDMLTHDCTTINFLPKFLDLDPDRGISLRNFHIQVSKLSTCSDFIFYNTEASPQKSSYIRVLWLAQQYEAFKDGLPQCQYNIFVVNEPINPITINKIIDHNDFQIKEKIEITRMSAATKLNQNVWVGNYWDYQAMITNLLEHQAVHDYSHHHTNHGYCNPIHSIINESSIHGNLVDYLPKPKANWKLFMYCHNDATFPNLNLLSNLLFKYTISSHHDDEIDQVQDYHLLEFPPSGSIGIGDCKKESLMSILNTCKLLYLYSSSNVSDDNVLSVLIYCSDGYTELSLFVLCYLMYAFNVSLSEAMLKLHLEFGRPFYIFNSDVLILTKLQSLLNKFSPLNKKVSSWSELEVISNTEINELLLGPSPSTTVQPSFKLGYIENDEDEAPTEPELDELAYANNNWVKDVEGSLPSQILPYIYLGSLKHANCLPLLNKLGIKAIISVGEQLDWLNGSKFRQYNKVVKSEEDKGNIEVFNIENTSNRYQCSVETIMKVNNLQDDGIDELSRSLPRILEFIDDEYVKSNGKTKILIHCRVGVSRSATVVIAEVMRRFNVGIPDAYLYVRVRRLNIIIQPNLRFMYELFKWDELQRLKKQDEPSDLRDIDWFIMCREVMKLNLPYLNN